jgi:hypothetical protein
MHPHLKKKICASLHTILSYSHAGKRLKDELSGLRSFRVSQFKSICRVSKKEQVEVATWVIGWKYMNRRTGSLPGRRNDAAEMVGFLVTEDYTVHGKGKGRRHISR